jgi:hypothetical protein
MNLEQVMLFREGRALKKCPVDIFSEVASWRAGKLQILTIVKNIILFLTKE